jgi:hypothetical protein
LLFNSDGAGDEERCSSARQVGTKILRNETSETDLTPHGRIGCETVFGIAEDNVVIAQQEIDPRKEQKTERSEPKTGTQATRLKKSGAITVGSSPCCISQVTVGSSPLAQSTLDAFGTVSSASLVLHHLHGFSSAEKRANQVC